RPVHGAEPAHQDDPGHGGADLHGQLRHRGGAAGQAADGGSGREPVRREHSPAGRQGPGDSGPGPVCESDIGGVTMRTKTTNYIIFECLSRSANEAFARGAVACFAAQLDPTLEELGDIKTAVSEAVTNAIVHAYPDTLGRVVVKAKILEDNVLEVTVRDWG